MKTLFTTVLGKFALMLAIMALAACQREQMSPEEATPVDHSSARASELSNKSLEKGLVAYYPFTGNAKDESGKKNNASVFNATLTTDRKGKNNRAYYFNGSNAYLLSTVAKIPQGKAPRTVSVWLKPDGYPGDMSFTAWAWGTRSDGMAQMLGLGQNSIISYQAWAIDSPVTYNYVSGEWIHVTVTYDGLNASIFINGTRVGGSSVPDWNTSGNQFYIGCRIGADVGHFKGSLDEVRVYKRVLNNEEINSLSKL